MPTPLKYSITSGFTKDKKVTEERLKLLDDMVRDLHNFSVRNTANPRGVDLTSEMLTFLKCYNQLIKDCYQLGDTLSNYKATLRKNAGLNEIKTLEEVTDLLPLGWKLTKDYVNNYDGLYLNFTLPLDSFPKLRDFPQLLKDNTINGKYDMRGYYNSLTQDYSWARKDKLASSQIYIDAIKEAHKINESISSLAKRGFSAHIFIKNISTRTILCKLSVHKQL